MPDQRIGGEELFRAMVESVKDYAIFATDAEGRVASWNTGAEAVFGYEEAEILGQGVSILFTPEDVARGAPEYELAKAAAEGRAEDERWHVRRDGSRFWASGVVTPIRGENGVLRGFVKVARDETARKRLESTLRQREQQLAALVENAPDIISRFDRDLRCTYTSPAVQGVLGLPPEELVGKTHAEMGLPPETCAFLDDTMRRVFETGRRESIEFSLTGLEGTRHYEAYAVPELGADGSVESIVAVSRDITKRRLAEQALRESEARFRQFAEHLDDVFWVMEMPEQRVVYVSPAFERLWGLSPDAVYASHGAWVASIFPEDRPRVAKAFLQKAHTGQYDEEYRIVRPDGVVRWIRDRCFPIKDESGRVRSVAGITDDITERRQAAAEREELLVREREARAAAEEANRLKNEFLATVSHELRAPLNSVLGWVGLLRGGHLQREQAETALETIERNARTQAQLIEDLLDVSRIITGRIRLDVRPVDPAAAARAAVDAVRPAAEAKGIELRKALDAGANLVYGDPERLQQVFWNLLSNAIKFTTEGGRVEVRLARVDSNVEISVSDTGAGIKPEFLPHVFDRFRQADGATTRRHGGLGLGLSIVRHLVELQGGSVSAHSEGEGRGATFVVRLPLAGVRRGAAEARDHDSAALPRLDGVRVLVVDDEPEARDLLRAIISRCGAEVTEAGSAAEALELVGRARPDVIVSDIGMPDEDGYILARRLRALPVGEGGATPAVALTAYTRAEDRASAIVAGYQMHVAKPVEAGELMAALATLSGRSSTD
jgi:PAS domain S-box-containing protein